MINRMLNTPAAQHVPGEVDAGHRSVSAIGRSNPILRRTEAAIAEHPKTSLFAALAAGVMLGWIVKRR